MDSSNGNGVGSIADCLEEFDTRYSESYSQLTASTPLKVSPIAHHQLSASLGPYSTDIPTLVSPSLDLIDTTVFIAYLDFESRLELSSPLMEEAPTFASQSPVRVKSPMRTPTSTYVRADVAGSSNSNSNGNHIHSVLHHQIANQTHISTSSDTMTDVGPGFANNNTSYSSGSITTTTNMYPRDSVRVPDLRRNKSFSFSTSLSVIRQTNNNSSNNNNNNYNNHMGVRHVQKEAASSTHANYTSTSPVTVAKLKRQLSISNPTKPSQYVGNPFYKRQLNKSASCLPSLDSMLLSRASSISRSNSKISKSRKSSLTKLEDSFCLASGVSRVGHSATSSATDTPTENDSDL